MPSFIGPLTSCRRCIDAAAHPAAGHGGAAGWDLDRHHAVPEMGHRLDQIFPGAAETNAHTGQPALVRRRPVWFGATGLGLILLVFASVTALQARW